MNDNKSAQVQARWKRGGGFEPSQFFWEGTIHRVESTGRSWEDESGYHVLCMVAGGQVFELTFRLGPAGWSIRPVPGSGAATA
jgi:hypothetical protein